MYASCLVAFASFVTVAVGEEAFSREVVQADLYLSFAGLPDDVSQPWGPPLINKDGSKFISRLKIGADNTHSPTPLYPGYPLLDIIRPGLPAPNDADFSALLKNNVVFQAGLNDTKEVVLGKHAAYLSNDTFYGRRNLNAFDSLDGFPFSINLGRAGKWNTTIVFNEYYDLNRIGQKFWGHLNSTSGFDDFYNTGKVMLGVYNVTDCDTDICDTGKRGLRPITLDFNSESIQLPKDLSCNRTARYHLSTPLDIDAAGIRVPKNLTMIPGRCTASNDNGVVLGKPFFQAAVIFFGNEVLVAEAHQDSAPFKSALFFGPVTDASRINPTSDASSDLGKKWLPVLTLGVALSIGVAIF